MRYILIDSIPGVGDIEVLDTLDNEFDGFKTKFQITKNEIPYSIVSRKGSPIDVEQTLIVFINDTLQKPGKYLHLMVVV